MNTIQLYHVAVKAANLEDLKYDLVDFEIGVQRFDEDDAWTPNWYAIVGQLDELEAAVNHLGAEFDPQPW